MQFRFGIEADIRILLNPGLTPLADDLLVFERTSTVGGADAGRAVLEVSLVVPEARRAILVEMLVIDMLCSHRRLPAILCLCRHLHGTDALRHAASDERGGVLRLHS